MTIGKGKHTYQWLSDWAKLPAGRKFGYTHGVVVDAADRVYLFNQSPDALCVFDREGKFIRSWGERFAKGAHGLYLSREGKDEFLWLADYELKISVKCTLDGQELMELGLPPRADIYPTAEKFKPTDVAVAPNGDIFVFDGYGTPWVHRYDKGGKYIQSIGGEGSGPGQLRQPHGGWVDTRRGEPELYVADRGNNRIQVFTLEGKHKRFITPPEMQMPCCFYEFQGQMYIPDLKARLTILDKDDRLVIHLGADPEAPATAGWPEIQSKLQPGKFSSPHAVCVDSSGDIYLVEWISTGRVTKLKRLAT